MFMYMYMYMYMYVYRKHSHRAHAATVLHVARLGESNNINFIVTATLVCVF